MYRRHLWMLDIPAGRFALGPNAVDYLEHALAMHGGAGACATDRRGAAPGASPADGVHHRCAIRNVGGDEHPS